MPQEWISFHQDELSVDENNDGVAEFSFDRPDFNVGQFLSNMVIRWEYIPGSTLFLVWTQQMDGDFYDGRNVRAYQFHFDEKPHNIFLIKYTYRLVR
jgi:hypothetical protein